MWRNHHLEHDAGESLQSDVMRFMAILALCLVAVFALVRSIPLSPEDPVAQEPATSPVPTQAAHTAKAFDAATGADAPTEPAATSVRTTTAERHSPAAHERPVLARATTSAPHREPPAPTTQVVATAAEPDTASSAPPSESVLTLRFATDSALEFLVAQGQVGLYAWQGDGVWRLRAGDGTLRFERAVPPPEFHAMAGETVPPRIEQALRQVAQDRVGMEVTWGVTLPTSMQHQLQRLLRRHRKGSLTILASGRIRAEAAD